jgi:hypothetical protein
MSERSLTRAAAVGLLGAGGAVVAAGFWVKNEATVDKPALAGEAQAARQRNEQAIEALGRVLEPRAAEAARVQPLASGLDNGIDARTFQDLFETEDWWAGVRKTAPYSALVAGNEVVASLGVERLEVASSPLVARARENKVASGVLRGAGRAYLAAAAEVTRVRNQERRPVVVIGEFVDEALLARVADRTGDAVGLADGSKLLESAGPPERRRVLQGLVGREAQSPLALDSGLVATAVPLGPGLTLWAVSGAPGGGGAAAGLSSKPVILWALGAAVMGIALGVMGRRRRPAQRARNEHEEGSALGRTNRTLYVGTPHEPHGDARAALQTPLPPGHVEPFRAASSPAMVRPSTVPIGAFPPGSGLHPPPGSGLHPPPGSGLHPPAGSGLHPPPAGSGLHAPVHPPAALAATAVAAPTAGDMMMGRYTLLERIGEGGMAEIYIAAAHGAEGFERRFVVKRLHAHLARRKEAVSQFIDEARLQAQLVHSNIVPVFDFGRVGEEYFLALEYIHGRDLEKLLQRHIQVFNRPLDLRIVAYVVHEVLEALSYAHGKRDQTGRPLHIVHRDVSPANVLISYQGEVKLTDFGIVKAGGRVSQTEMGMVKGNASFMSPEQARGTQVDARSDLFSTGVVMFCCLTGQALYQGETTLNQLVRAAVGPATAQFQAIETLPEQSVPILSKALMLDPAHRYQSAGEFARELAPMIHGVKGELARLMEQLFPDARRSTG